jgi:hypothetical protein
MLQEIGEGMVRDCQPSQPSTHSHHAPINLHFPKDASQLDGIVKDADKNGDGEINFEEFMHMMQARKRLLSLARSMMASGMVQSSNSDTHSMGALSQTSGMGDLPSLRIPRKISKRHLTEAQYDHFFSRPTPHCLKVGIKQPMDITALRRELEIFKYGVEQLEDKVKEGVSWVRSNMPVTSLKAQLFCQKWGVERFQNVFKQIQNKSLLAATVKWKEFVSFEISKEKAQRYLQTTGTRKVPPPPSPRSHCCFHGSCDFSLTTCTFIFLHMQR